MIMRLVRQNIVRTVVIMRGGYQAGKHLGQKQYVISAGQIIAG
jgi:hypothetical protein